LQYRMSGTGVPRSQRREDAGLEARGPARLEAGQVEALFPRTGDGVVVTSVGVAHDAGSGVVPQHACEAPRRLGRAVADDDPARMLGDAEGAAADVTDGHAARSARAVGQRL